MYYILVDPKIRNQILKYLKKNNISATFHYLPLHSSPYIIKKTKIKYNNLKNTNLISKSIIRLPFHNSLREKDIENISATIKKFFYDK